MLMITSLISILLFSLHWADEVSRGLERGDLSSVGGIVILVVWLSAALLLRDRPVGLVLLLLASILGTGVPIVHMSGRGLVGGRIPAGSDGSLFWVWTNLAMSPVSAIALFLSVYGLWSRRRSA
jgi:hypothetical protein